MGAYSTSWKSILIGRVRDILETRSLNPENPIRAWHLERILPHHFDILQLNESQEQSQVIANLAKLYQLALGYPISYHCHAEVSSGENTETLSAQLENRFSRRAGTMEDYYKYLNVKRLETDKITPAEHWLRYEHGNIFSVADLQKCHAEMKEIVMPFLQGNGEHEEEKVKQSQLEKVTFENIMVSITDLYREHLESNLRETPTKHVWHPDVRTFKAEGLDSHTLIYFDPFHRQGKTDRPLTMILDEERAAVLLNFKAPAWSEDEWHPVSIDEIRDCFHEWGHAMDMGKSKFSLSEVFPKLMEWHAYDFMDLRPSKVQKSRELLELVFRSDLELTIFHDYNTEEKALLDLVNDKVKEYGLRDLSVPSTEILCDVMADHAFHPMASYRYLVAEILAADLFANKKSPWAMLRGTERVTLSCDALRNYFQNSLDLES